MELKVYLSSTLKDLEAERRAVREALADQCVVKHSYFASEDALVESCLNEVAACDLYIAILGLRYGHVPGHPFDNPAQRSITELEYLHAVEHEIPRLVFIKDENAIPVPQTDYRTKEHAPERIETFRLTAGAGADQRPATFATIPELREHAIKAFNAFKEKRARGSGSPARDPGTVQPSSYEAIRREYVSWLRSACENIILFGADDRDRKRDVRLGQVYVPALSETVQPTRALQAGQVLRETRRMEPLLQRLGRESLYVPGAPGSGKSTFCRWVALAVSNGALAATPQDVPEELREQMPDSLVGRFPVWCELRDWSAGETARLEGHGTWKRRRLEDSIANWLDSSSPGGLSAAPWRESLEQGKCLLIFDGVDEIPEQLAAESSSPVSESHYPRSNFLTGLADALPAWTTAGNRVLLTSRPYGVEDIARARLSLAQADLAPMPRELQTIFVHHWFRAANVADSEKKARGLVEHLDGRPDLEELRPNPMLLTTLCVKYDQDLRLPGDLYRLYDAVVKIALHKRFPTEPERERAQLRLAAIALRMHAGAPDDARTTPVAEVSYEEVEGALIELARTDRTSEEGGMDAVEKRDLLLSRSGILVSRPNRRASFYHLSFQEFLAAIRIRRAGDDTREVLRRHMHAPEWRRTLRFLFCAIADQASPERALRECSMLLDELSPDQLAGGPNPALLLADCLEVGHARRWELRVPVEGRIVDFEKPLRAACDAALTACEPSARAHLWRVLGQIGLDDRPGVGVRDGVPDIEWRDVPAGPFEYGDDRIAANLPAFRVARYPITNAQFQSFVDDREGFDQDRWWQWPERRAESSKPGFPHPNHPRETVSWFEAMAFCAWLTARLRGQGTLSERDEVRLPTEQEWEKAARGTDGRVYPWGDNYESGRANIDETVGRAGPYYLERTSAVGSYPLGESPYGVDDMAGNVWEWCLNPYELGDGSVDAARVVRGGSWLSNHVNARSASRNYGHPDTRLDGIGFRVVCVSPIS